MGFAKGFDLSDQVFHAAVMGEISPTVKQDWGKFREYPRHGYPCDISPMPDIDAIRAGQQNAMLMRETLLNIQHACESAERRLSGIEAMIYNATKYRGTSLDQMQAMQENDI